MTRGSTSAVPPGPAMVLVEGLTTARPRVKSGRAAKPAVVRKPSLETGTASFTPAAPDPLGNHRKIIGTSSSHEQGQERNLTGIGLAGGLDAHLHA